MADAHSPLIDAATLAGSTAPQALVVDCRFDLADPGKGGRDYMTAHIPGAVYASLDHELSDLSKQRLGRHPLPDESAFSATLSRWGWQPGTRIVAYDDHGGALAAARLWWLLRTAGIDAVVLDGGIGVWRDAGLVLESGSAAQRAPTEIEIHFDPAAIVLYDELQRLRARPSTLLLDARAAPRYRGESEPIDRIAGHVPGARNRPFPENLQADGRFKPAATLREEFVALLRGYAPDEVVHMCGSGVTAAHNLLAMERAGLSGSRLFAPSWSGWVDDPKRPVATGAD